ncbi:MAG: hypothetical protein VB142_02430 [Burkholderia sp.]
MASTTSCSTSITAEHGLYAETELAVHDAGEAMGRLAMETDH